MDNYHLEHCIFWY